jgi:hypothetical protein
VEAAHFTLAAAGQVKEIHLQLVRAVQELVVMAAQKLVALQQQEQLILVLAVVEVLKILPLLLQVLLVVQAL